MNTNETGEVQNAPTAQDIFDMATQGERINYVLYWCLNKMAYAKVEGRTKKEYDQNVTTFSRWVSYKDAQFILSKIHYYSGECFRDDQKVWWYYKEHSCYEYYHIMPNGGSIHATIHRSGINGNRQIVVRHFERHFTNMKGIQ